MRTRLVVSVALLLPLLLAPSARAASAAATVTLIEGTATAASAGGSTRTLHHGSRVLQGATVSTGPRSRLALTLADGSVVRLAPDSRLRLGKVAYSGPKATKKIRLQLLAGKLWTDVVKLVDADSVYEIVSEHAKAGVRGTTFRVDARTDKSVLVRVYAGTVAVASAGAPLPEHSRRSPDRVQVKPPAEVTRAEWERIVTSQMQVTVDADGNPGETTAFAAADEVTDEWAMWNRQQDGH